VNPTRRAWLLALPAHAIGAPGHDDDAVREDRVLRFPRDHGAHAGARNEWWYATGWLDQPGGAPPIGFQVTFFRHRTGLAAGLPGRLAPRQLLFAHAALSDIGAQHHLQAQCLQRWSGDEEARDLHARRADTDVRIGTWWLRRSGAEAESRYVGAVGGGEAPFRLQLELQATQPLLLQGRAGHSRKGPLDSQASHYYSLPQLRAQARIERPSGALQLRGSAWLDHEWSDEYLPSGAVGWDWIGINLHDGGALMAFRLRRADGSALWAGGTHRSADGLLRTFEPDDLTFVPQRRWTSPATQARYPVQWSIATPAGRFAVQALMDAQELDGRGSNGAVYWEGLSDLFDEAGRRVGRGYLEMTGYSKPLQM
jgi:predicted secreted hydrolase